MKTYLSMLVLTIVSVVNADSYAEQLKLPAIFSDGMVLQSGETLPVWGTANSKADVTVQFTGQKKTTTADAEGKWLIRLDAMEVSSTGRRMIISSGDQSEAINDVLVGEVWFCSGQSNMAVPLSFLGGKAAEERYQPIADYIQKEIKTAKDPLLRQFNVGGATSPFNELNTMQGSWISSSPSTNWSFTGTGYFFGKELRAKLKAPVGLIKSAYGGTRIEAWIAKSGYMEFGALKTRYEKDIQSLKQKSDAWDQERADKEFSEKMKKWEEDGKQGRLPGKPRRPESNVQFQATLFNGMVHPVIPYGIKGVIWYQGETNAMTNGDEYTVLFEALVNSWRKAWGKADMPFYMAQLANWKGFRDWMKVCDAQRRAIGKVQNTGMAVLYDIGEEKDIHPNNKDDVGKRLALWALKNDYKLDIPVCSGPLYRSHEVNGDHIIVAFDRAGSGLMVGHKELLNETTEVNEPLKHFEVAGVDVDWQPARAEITGKNTIKVWSETVPQPTRVRYAWKPNPVGVNLYNKEGLPASLFTSELNLVDIQLRSETKPEFFDSLQKVFGAYPVQGTTIKPESPGKNIALEADVQASSVAGDQLPKMAIDGNLDTGWASAKEGNKAWITINLGKKYRITHVGYRSRPGVFDTVTSFRLTFGDGSHQMCFLDENKQNEFQYFDIKDVDTNLMRWAVFQSKFANTGAMDIAVYGVPAD